MLGTRYAIILLVLACSCDPEPPDGWTLANEFCERHASEFIENQELLKYSYNPRSQFFYNINRINDIDSSFRCIIRDSTELLVINFDGFDIFRNEFGIELDSSLSFKRGEFTNEGNSFILTVNDSVRINVLAFKTNPIKYFTELKSNVEDFGIVTFGKLRIGGIIEVYLTGTDYLLYFPSDLNVGQAHFEEYWENKKSKGRMIDSNWYYYEAERPLDFG